MLSESRGHIVMWKQKWFQTSEARINAFRFLNGPPEGECFTAQEYVIFTFQNLFSEPNFCLFRLTPVDARLTHTCGVRRWQEHGRQYAHTPGAAPSLDF